MTSDHCSLKLIQGTVDLLILRTLTRGPQHGYGVSAWIREKSVGELRIDEAALYQSLHRLERRGLLASEWGLSDNNRRAKLRNHPQRASASDRGLVDVAALRAGCHGRARDFVTKLRL